MVTLKSSIIYRFFFSTKIKKWQTRFAQPQQILEWQLSMEKVGRLLCLENSLCIGTVGDKLPWVQNYIDKCVLLVSDVLVKWKSKVVVFVLTKVHALFSTCNMDVFFWNWFPPCICGIAVRVKDSLYVYRTCEEISHRYAKPLIHHDMVYQICDNRHMVIDIGDPYTKVFFKKSLPKVIQKEKQFNETSSLKTVILIIFLNCISSKIQVKK